MVRYLFYTIGDLTYQSPLVFLLPNWLGRGTSNVVVRQDVILSFRQLHSCYESTQLLSVPDYLNEFHVLPLLFCYIRDK